MNQKTMVAAAAVMLGFGSALVGVGCAPAPDVERQAELIATIDAHSGALAELRSCLSTAAGNIGWLGCLAGYAERNPLVSAPVADDRSRTDRLLDAGLDIGLGLGEAGVDRARRAIEGGER